jgi:hypothetical protein
METLNELVIENLIDQLDTQSLIRFYQASEKPMKQIIKSLIQYKTIAEKVMNKALRECLISVLTKTRLDMFDDLNQYYQLENYGYRKDFLREERKKEVDKMMNELSSADRLKILQEYTDSHFITLHSLMYDPELTSKIRRNATQREKSVLQRYYNHKLEVIQNLLDRLVFSQLLDLSVALGDFLEQSPNHPKPVYLEYQSCLQRRVRYLSTNFGLVIDPEERKIVFI